MNNQLENNTMETMEDLSNIKLEMLHYRPNGLSYKLGFLGIAFSVLAAFLCLNSFQPNVLAIFKILMNIAILLFGFMFCESAKNYSRNASIFLCVLGGVCILRIFWVPLSLITWYSKFQAGTVSEEEAKTHLGGTIMGEGVNWIWKSGNIRGIIAIVFLGCAAAAFISAGVIGIIKNNEYNKIKDIK